MILWTRPMPAALLPQVEQHALARLRDHLQRLVELVAAVAARGGEDVAGQALRVHAHQHLVLGLDLAHDQRHVVLLVDQALEGVDAEGAVAGGQVGLGDLAHQALVPHAVLDQVLDGDQLAGRAARQKRLEPRRRAPWCRPRP